MQRLDSVVIEPVSKTTACVIWLHGLGADGHDFAGVISELGLNENHGIRFIFPHAPSMPVTVNNGYKMPAWYDIYSQNLGSQQDLEGIINSSEKVNLLIEEQINKGVPADKIILAGFSQGGAVALFSNFHIKKKLAGIIAISCYLPVQDYISKNYSDIENNMPIAMMHGIYDDVVTLQLAESSVDELQKLGIGTHWKTYNIAHSVCKEELLDIGECIRLFLNLR